MEQHIDLHKCHYAFATILSDGEKTDRGYCLNGVWAESLDDGYTVRLFDGVSELLIFFHNKYELNSPDTATAEKFMASVCRIAERTSPKTKE
ncbi:hypothetical protein CI610_01954 [invertebrate metagenome]|uniref:DUF3081 domain-containing protein n=1 Tax=invertebrate metagenome TaxID=1711999 RepID=A0A2H9T781_9ZZZZ